MPKWMKTTQGHYRRIDPANKMDINIYLNKVDKNDIEMIEMILHSSNSSTCVVWRKSKRADGSRYMAIEYPVIEPISASRFQEIKHFSFHSMNTEFIEKFLNDDMRKSSSTNPHPSFNHANHIPLLRVHELQLILNVVSVLTFLFLAFQNGDYHRLFSLSGTISFFYSCARFVVMSLMGNLIFRLMHRYAAQHADSVSIFFIPLGIITHIYDFMLSAPKQISDYYHLYRLLEIGGINYLDEKRHQFKMSVSSVFSAYLREIKNLISHPDAPLFTTIVTIPLFLYNAYTVLPKSLFQFLPPVAVITFFVLQIKRIGSFETFELILDIAFSLYTGAFLLPIVFIMFSIGMFVLLNVAIEAAIGLNLINFFSQHTTVLFSVMSVLGPALLFNPLHYTLIKKSLDLYRHRHFGNYEEYLFGGAKALLSLLGRAQNWEKNHSEETDEVVPSVFNPSKGYDTKTSLLTLAYKEADKTIGSHLSIFIESLIHGTRQSQVNKCDLVLELSEQQNANITSFKSVLFPVKGKVRSRRYVDEEIAQLENKNKNFDTMPLSSIQKQKLNASIQHDKVHRPYYQLTKVYGFLLWLYGASALTLKSHNCISWAISKVSQAGLPLSPRLQNLQYSLFPGVSNQGITTPYKNSCKDSTYVPQCKALNLP